MVFDFRFCIFQEFKAMQNGRKRSKSCATEWTRNKKVSFGYEEQRDHLAKEEAREIPSDKVCSISTYLPYIH